MKLFKQLSTVFFMVCATIASCVAQTQPANCNSDEHRQFDFWVGDWVVTDRAGKIQGHNKIELLLDNCTLQENWRGAKGSEGKSLNFYDRATQQWHQTWIDRSGGVLYLNGGLEDNAMVLAGERPGKDGRRVLHEIRYMPLDDGDVEQHWRFSKDNGKTWQDLFLGIYKKKSSSGAM